MFKFISLKPYLLVITFFLCHLSYGQSPVYKKLGVESGLPSSEVLDLFTDNKGLVWIGHRKGISSFDGSTFKTYSNPKQSSLALSDIHQDYLGRIWCHNFTGQVFYIENDSLKLFEDFNSNLISNYSSIFIYRGKELFISEDYAVFYKNLETGTIKKLKPKDHAKDSAFRVTLIEKGPNQKLLFQTFYSGFYEYKDSELVPYKLIENQNPILPEHKNEVMRFISGPEELLFTYLSQPYFGLVKDKKKTILKIFKENINLANLRYTSDKRFWINTYNGTYLLKEDFSGIEEHLFKGDAISDIILDREGNYWFSSLKNGIFIIASRKVKILETDVNPLGEARISCLSKDGENNLLIGLDDGKIVSYNPYFFKINKIWKVNDNKNIEHIYYDKSNNLILISARDIYSLNPKENSPKLLFGGGYIKQIKPLEKNYYLAAGPSGITVFHVVNYELKAIDRSKYSFIRDYVYQSPLSGKLASVGFAQRSNCIEYDSNNKNLWVSNKSGVFVYHENAENPLLITENGEKIYATDICIFNNEIWLATVNAGLFVYKNTSKTKEFNKNSGLGSNSIRKIRCSDKYLWIIEENGIYRYNPEKKLLENLSAGNGISEKELLDLQIIDHNIYTSSTTDIFYFKETLKPSIPNDIPIYISSVLANNVNLLINDGQIPELTFNQNNLLINYYSIAFINRKNLSYKYRLKEQDTNWYYLTGDQQSVRIASLSPGIYTFEIKAISQNGIKSKTAASFKFIIKAPVYTQWWFILFIVMFLGLIIFAINRIRLKNLESKNKRALEKVNLEKELRNSMLSSIKAQMNPHFIFNALNTIQSYIFTNDKIHANSYLGKFSELMRLVLDLSNQERVFLVDEIKTLRLYLELEKMRFEDTLEFVITVEGSINVEEILIPSMLIQPFVENSIKHGLLHKNSDRKLWVDFTLVEENTVLQVIVEDNGVGRKRAQEINRSRKRSHKSFSAEANKKRLEILNSGNRNPIVVDFIDKDDLEGNSTGTRVILRIPIMKSNLVKN